jgi:hypothetical protein
MNLCDYYVKEVLEKPIFIDAYKDAGVTWWQVKVSYTYDNGDLKTTDLTFDTKEEAEQVKEGYHFLA